MDCVEQGGGTVLLESYESSCDETVPLNPTPTIPLGKGATEIMETYQSTASASAEEESTDKKDESQTVAVPDTVTASDEAHENGTDEVKKEEGTRFYNKTDGPYVIKYK